MFSLIVDMIVSMQARTVANDDGEGAAAVNETIELWTKMCKAESDRNKVIQLRFESMMNSFEGCLSKLMENIDKLKLWAQAETILNAAKSWAVQMKAGVCLELRSVLSKLDSLEADINEGNLVREQLSSQVSSLQDWKRKLEASISEMVPRSELAVEKAEACQRQSVAAERIKALHEGNSALKQENDQLKAAMQVRTVSTGQIGIIHPFRSSQL